MSRKTIQIQKFSKDKMKNEQVLECGMRKNVWKESEEEKAKKGDRTFYNLTRNTRYEMTQLAACIFSVMTETEYQEFCSRIEVLTKAGKGTVQPFKYELEPHKTKEELKKEKEKKSKIQKGKKIIAAAQKK